MTGGEALDQVRYYSGDHEIGHYIELQRAIRQFCQHTGFPFLREADDAAWAIKSGVTVYTLGVQGWRQVRNLWVQSATSGKWYQLDEATQISFEDRLSKFVDSNGTITSEIPQFYKIEGTGDGDANFIKVTLGPTPDQDYNGRIDGISNTPVVSHSRELPGPEDYHDTLVRLAAGFHKQAMGSAKLQMAHGQEEMMVAQAVTADGARMEMMARSEFEKIVRDQMPNRRVSPTWARARIMR